MSDLSQYVPKLPFDTPGRFEATSGLMILNVDSETFYQSGKNFANGTATPQDNELYSTINHEMYHYFQALTTGYQYLYASEMWRLIVEEAGLERRRQFFKNCQGWVKSKAVKLYALLRFGRSWLSEMDLLMGFQNLVNETAQAQKWQDAATGGDFSIVAAASPSLAKGFDKMWAKVTAPATSGLSTLDLIEGSASVYEHMLARGREGLEARLAAAWESMGETYRRAYDVATAICGERALDVLLPAAALALRYSNPAEAYPVFLSKLKSAAPGTERSEARTLVSNPPKISAAGSYLGTAIDVRRRQRYRRKRYQIYDDVLDKLEKRAWNSDEIDLLTDPSCAEKVTEFPFVVVVKDGPVRTNSLEDAELIRRLICGGIVLRAPKVPRFSRDADQRLVGRAHAMLAAVIDPLQAASEYTQLGVASLNEGNLIQAKALFERALGIYESHDDKQGMAIQFFNLGLVYGNRKKTKDAKKMYGKSLDLAEAVADRPRIAQAAANLGSLYISETQLDLAEPLIRKALAIEQDLDLKPGLAIDYCNLGKICFARGDLDQAQEFMTKALEVYTDLGDNTMVRAIKRGLEDIAGRVSKIRQE